MAPTEDELKVQSPFNCSLGSCNADIDEIYNFQEISLWSLWWRLVTDHPHKCFDNSHNQELIFT